jgi:creatinine amidohydrolase/Fe(II)-dependent formamide hydrolase-like protein
VHAGFVNLLVLNGHGGNIAPCRAVWDQFLREFQVNLHFLSYWDVLTQEDASTLLRSGHRLPEDLPGHAQEFETSMALARFPQNVDSEVIGNQPDPAPLLASAEQGREFFERIVTRLAERVQQMIAGERLAAVPPFHP